MKESFFKLLKNPEVIKVDFVKNIEFNKIGSVGLKLETKNNIYCDRNNKLAQIEFSTEIFKNEDREVPFEITVEIQGLFSWSEDIANDEQQLNDLLKLNAPAILYSYLRPVISNLTVQAGLTPLVLPVMNFKDSENKIIEVELKL